MISICLTNIFINFCISAIVNIIAKIKSMWIRKPPVIQNLDQQPERQEGLIIRLRIIDMSQSIIEPTSVSSPIKKGNSNRLEI